MAFITVKKAAQILGVSTKRVSLLCLQGTIKAERVGARIYVIDPTSLEAYRHEPARKKHRPNVLSPGRPPQKNRQVKKR